MSRFLPHQGLFLYISPGLFFFLFNFVSFQPDYHSYHGYQNYNHHYIFLELFFFSSVGCGGIWLSQLKDKKENLQDMFSCPH
jgi:hypothetical protein